MSTELRSEPRSADGPRTLVHVDPSQLLREARRHAGYSQRHLAAVSGLSLRTVVDVECGRRRVSAQALDALLEACGLDVTLCLRGDHNVPPDVRAHLGRSTTARLRQHCGGTDSGPDDGRDDRPPLWRQLCDVARRASSVLLDGPDAAGVWTPVVPALRRASVGVGPRSAQVRSSSLVEVQVLPARSAPYRARNGVHIAVPGGGRVVVPTPAELLLDPRCAGLGEPLRVAARCLHLEAGRDDGGRRAPPHRDPDEDREGENLSRSLTYAMDGRRLPEPTDGRGWRVDAPVSLRQWHEQNGHPPRLGSRRSPGRVAG